MATSERVRSELGAAMSGATSARTAADQLCHACVGLLDVDGASVSLAFEGANRGTFGSSGELSRRLDELQFTYGEGPCLDAVRDGAPVLVPDLDDPSDTRWPALTRALLDAGVSAVFALPVTMSQRHVGALDLFRNRRGPLSEQALDGGLLAAELAALPLLDMLAEHQAEDWDAGGRDGWTELSSIQRVEVYQATGMIMAALDVDSAEALIRLRAHAFASNLTAQEVAWAIVERRLPLDSPDWRDPSGSVGPSQ